MRVNGWRCLLVAMLAILGLVALGPGSASAAAQPAQYGYDRAGVTYDPAGTPAPASTGMRSFESLSHPAPPRSNDVSRETLSKATEFGVAAETGAVDLPAATTWGRAETLARHFADHGTDFGATSAEQYAQQASAFFQRGITEGLPIKVAPKSGVIRIYDPESNMFGAYNANGTTRTFYAPDPAVHGYPPNWDYWVSQPGSAPWGP